MADKDLNSKDVKDFAKALSAAASSMATLSKYADIFSKNISGAKNYLDSINESQAKNNNLLDDTNNLTEQAAQNQKKTNDILDDTNDKLKQASQKSKDFKAGMKASAAVLYDMAGSAGFGGLVNLIGDVAVAFIKGGPILAGMSIFMSAITFVFNKFLEIDAQVEEIASGIGKGGGFAQGLAVSSFNISRNFASFGIDIKAAGEAAISLGKEFSNLDYVTGKNQTTIALMGKQLGIGAAASAKALGTFMNMTGSTFDTAKNMAAVAMSVAKTSNLPLGAIMEDLSANSESAAKYGGKFSQSTIIASAAAKKMGMSFADVAKIAEGILDIESSVEKQFEAQVLLGRDVNLEQARYYSLIGDTSKMQKEVLKQVGSQAQFEKMMPMQRQALADAIGIGVEQLGKMVSRQKEGMSVEEKTYNLQKQALDSQLKGSDRMIGIAKTLEGAFTELGYAVLGLLGFNMGTFYKDGAELGENFVRMIRELTAQTIKGEGPIAAIVKTVKEWIKVAQEWAPKIKNIWEQTKYLVKVMWDWKYVILGIWAIFKAASFLNSLGLLGNLFGVAGTAAARSSLGIKVFLGALASGLAFFANAKVAIGLGVITLGFIGLGLALKLAAPAFEAIAPVLMKIAEVIGNVLMKALEMAGPIITSILNGIGKVILSIGNAISGVITSLKDFTTNFLDKIMLANPLQIAALGTSLFVLAGGLLALAGGGLFSGLLTGLSSLIGIDPAKQINNIMNSIGVLSDNKIKTINSLATLFDGFSKVSAGNIRDSMKALSEGITNLGNTKAVLSVQSTQYQKSPTEQIVYYSESLKYLKVIALATTVMAEKGGSNIRLSNIDDTLTRQLQ